MNPMISEKTVYDIAARVILYSKELAKRYGADEASDICGDIIRVIMDEWKKEGKKMTNREKLIEYLENDDTEAYMALMCPYLPTDEECYCNGDCDAADFAKDCTPCMREWLDKEVE